MTFFQLESGIFFTPSKFSCIISYFKSLLDKSGTHKVSPIYRCVDSKSSELWSSLTKQAPETPLKWSQTRSHNQLYSSLRIDTRNIVSYEKDILRFHYALLLFRGDMLLCYCRISALNLASFIIFRLFLQCLNFKNT